MGYRYVSCIKVRFTGIERVNKTPPYFKSVPMYFHSGDKSSAASSAIPWKKHETHIYSYRKVKKCESNGNEQSWNQSRIRICKKLLHFGPPISRSVIICKDPDHSLFSTEKTRFLSESLKPFKSKIRRIPQKRDGYGFRNTQKTKTFNKGIIWRIPVLSYAF